MAAPGTITHVLEVAAQLHEAAGTHAATIAETAAAAVPSEPAPPPRADDAQR